MEMSQVVKLLSLEEISFADLEVSSTAVEEDSNVLQAQELERETRPMNAR